MKSNKSLSASGKRRASADRRRSAGRAVVLDFIQSRIEAFNEEHGGGVRVRKDAYGYTLFRDDNAQPVARLRPRETGNRFEILYRSRCGDRWKPVAPFGAMFLSLEDALQFIASDPMGCFWH